LNSCNPKELGGPQGPKMVFEGILVEVLNTFLSDYIENLDKDQLSVAVWSGEYT
jgi:N-terminal region of Chorein or VPS13